MFTPAIDFETPSSRAVTWRVQPPLDCLTCASANENLRLGNVPESVAGGFRRSGFWPSRATSRGTGSVPPTPDARLGSGGGSADCAAVAPITAPAATAVDRISLRENALIHPPCDGVTPCLSCARASPDRSRIVVCANNACQHPG